MVQVLKSCRFTVTIGLNPCKINSDTQWLDGKRALVTEHPHFTCLHLFFFGSRIYANSLLQVYLSDRLKQ